MNQRDRIKRRKKKTKKETKRENDTEYYTVKIFIDVNTVSINVMMI